MEFTIKSGSPEKQRSACVVVGVFDNRKPSLSAELIDRASGGYISEIIRRGDMEGKLGATLLLLSFGPGRWRSLVGGASQAEVETAFAGWQMLAAEPADTAGLGWPMNTTAPQWYRLRRGT